MSKKSSVVDHPNKKIFWIVLGALFLLPRAIRLLYPYVWIEDPFYLYASYLIKHGFLPFRDFGHTQLPGTEYFLALIYALFGNSYIVAETASQIVVYLNTWLIFFIGRKLCNQPIGILAALLFSCSSLLFRYHVWEREVLVLFLLTIIFYLFLVWQRLSIKRIAVLSVVLMLGIILKLTSVVPAAATVLFLVVVRKERRNALILATMVFVLTAVILLLIFMVSPENVFNQVFLYHFVKGDTFTAKFKMLLFPLQALDISLALGALGVFFWKKNLFPNFWFPVFLALSEWVFFSFVSPNVWPHNYIPSLLLLSLSGGMFIFFTWEMAWKRQKKLVPVLSIFFLSIMLGYVCPLKNLNWVMNSTYGFGYVPRKDISQLSQYIQTNTTSDDLLLLPQYIASESGRRNLVSDRIEAAGVFRWIEARRKEGRSIRTIIKMSKGKSFSQMQKETLPLGWGRVALLLREKRIKMIVLDVVPGERIPFSPQYLSQLGYLPQKKYGWYVVWTPQTKHRIPAPNI